MASSTSISAPAGTYTETSTNIIFKENPEAPGAYILSADCQTNGGASVASTLDFGIQNCNGVLKWSPTNTACTAEPGAPYPAVPAGIPAGSYLLSSTDVVLTNNNGGGTAPYTLTASAQKKDGSYTPATLQYDIANCNGVLKWNPKYGC